MWRPLPNHATLSLPNDYDDEDVAVLTCCYYVFLAQCVADTTAVVAVQVVAVPTGRCRSTVTAVTAVYVPVVLAVAGNQP